MFWAGTANDLAALQALEVRREVEVEDGVRGAPRQQAGPRERDGIRLGLVTLLLGQALAPASLIPSTTSDMTGPCTVRTVMRWSAPPATRMTSSQVVIVSQSPSRR